LLAPFLAPHGIECFRPLAHALRRNALALVRQVALAEQLLQHYQLLGAELGLSNSRTVWMRTAY
jgi:hypothetical protein